MSRDTLAIYKGVLRDGTWRYLEGFTFNIDHCLVLKVEVWEVFHDLHFVWTVGIPKVVLELVSFTIISLVSLGIKSAYGF